MNTPLVQSGPHNNIVFLAIVMKLQNTRKAGKAGKAGETVNLYSAVKETVKMILSTYFNRTCCFEAATTM